MNCLLKCLESDGLLVNQNLGVLLRIWELQTHGLPLISSPAYSTILFLKFCAIGSSCRKCRKLIVMAKFNNFCIFCVKQQKNLITLNQWWGALGWNVHMILVPRLGIEPGSKVKELGTHVLSYGPRALWVAMMYRSHWGNYSMFEEAYVLLWIMMVILHEVKASGPKSP